MRTDPFRGNEYHTDDKLKRIIFDRLFFNTQFGFSILFVSLLKTARNIALEGKYDTEKWSKTSLEIFTLLEKCGGRFHITGLENLNNCKEPVVFIGNHMSTLETMILPGIIAPVVETTFVVKDSLVTHPFFGPIMRARNPIVVGRSDSRADFNTVMNEGLEHLKKGTSVIIFPQSRRTVEFVPKEFNSLGIKLAKSANVKVIPMALKTDFWENGTLIKDLGPLRRNRPIHLEFGKPMSISGNGKEEHQAIIDFISNKLTDWNK